MREKNHHKLLLSKTLKPTQSLIFLFFLLIFSWANSQKAKENPKKKIDIINANVIEQKPELYNGNLVLSGLVKLHHNGAILDADTVILDQAANLFVAKSNVVLNIGDTVTLRCRKLDYNGNTQKAIAYDNVKLQDKSQTLETEKLYYDRITNTAYYNTRSKITQQGNVMYSNSGVYDLNKRSTTFEKDVILDNKESIIRSEDLTFFNAQQKAVVKGPTTITDKKNPKTVIYTENGEYFTKTKESYLYKNSRVYYEDKILKGNTLYFNQLTGFGTGKGNVTIEDPKEKRFLKADYGEVYQFKDSAMVTGKPYLVKAFEKDSLYISAQKITAARDKEKKSTIRAYKKARFFKSDLQGKSDSIVYKETLGQIDFYKRPIFWSGERQITGDTIQVFVNNKTQQTDSIKVFQNAFAISKVDSLAQNEYNQVKGKHIFGKFENDYLNYVRVEGNAQSLVYVDEEDKKKQNKKRIGINKSDCGIIEADFVGKQEVNIISCKINAEAELFPEDKIEPNQRFLKDFVWLAKERLTTWKDIFLEIPDNNNQNFVPTELPTKPKPRKKSNENNQNQIKNNIPTKNKIPRLNTLKDNNTQ